MSRSFKRPVVKDNGIGKRFYHRTVRRVQKQAIRDGKDIPNRRIIINDYDYCDYIFNYDTWKARNGTWRGMWETEAEWFSKAHRK